MKAIQFIKKDLSSKRDIQFLLRQSLILGALPVGLGLGLRKDWGEAFVMSNLVPGFVVMLPVLFFLFVYSEVRIQLRTRLYFLGVLFVLSFLFSFMQPQTEVSLAKFETVLRFWPETRYCFFLGLGIGVVGISVINFVVWKFLPLPNRIWQVGLSATCSLFAVTGLSFHCMGALKMHVLIGHWGEALVLFATSMLVQRLLFLKKMNFSSSIRNPYRVS